MLIASFSIGIGAISSLIYHQVRKQGIVKIGNHKKKNKEEHYFDMNKNNSDLNMMRNELDSLEVEKSIIISSVRKIHESFQEGKLSQLEFDRLMIKYDQDLRKCDEEIEQTGSVVDLYDLSSLRNNLVSIIEDKIKVIDTRLNEISNRNFKVPTKQQRQIQHDPIQLNFEKTLISGANLDSSLRIESEKIKKLDIEITQALDKLDSYDHIKSRGTVIESLKNDLELSRDQNVPNKRDPLRNFPPSN